MAARLGKGVARGEVVIECACLNSNAGASLLSMRKFCFAIAVLPILLSNNFAHAADSIDEADANIFNKDVKTKAKMIDGYIIDSDYPEEAIAANASGTVVAEFVIGPNGIVSLCGVAGSSGNDALDSRSCELIRSRFTFQPALDKNRKPIAERRVQRITWRMPIVPLPTNHDYSVIYKIGPDGKRLDCRLEGIPPPQVDGEKLCATIPTFMVPTDAKGRTVTREYIYRQILLSRDVATSAGK